MSGSYIARDDKTEICHEKEAAATFHHRANEYFRSVLAEVHLESALSMLCCVLLYSDLLCYVLLCSAVFCCALLCSTVLSCVLLFSAVLCQCSTMFCCVLICSVNALLVAPGATQRCGVMIFLEIAEKDFLDKGV